MAPKDTQRTEIDRQIPEKNILYTSPPEARNLDKWIGEVEAKNADKPCQGTQSDQSGTGAGKLQS